ncbi:hypothetical protein EDD16DRAFT_598210 [Pisolithus croceorrhizus]|nr:hypothetical protein EDD16DRAFT_598210 [Pisolithus croceorrhizus]
MCSGSAEFLSQRDFVGFCILSFVAMSFFVGLVMGVLTLAIASQVKGSLNSSMTILKGRFRSTCNLPECIPVVRSLCSSTNKARSAPGLIGWKTKKTSLLSPIMPLCLKQRPFPSSDHWFRWITTQRCAGSSLLLGTHFRRLSKRYLPWLSMTCPAPYALVCSANHSRYLTVDTPTVVHAWRVSSQSKWKDVHLHSIAVPHATTMPQVHLYQPSFCMDYWMG